MADLGKEIRAARLAKKWSQGELAKSIGVTRNAVSLWESGDTKPKAENLLKAMMLLDGKKLRELTVGKSEVKDDGQVTTAPMLVKGEIRAGAWLELEDTEQDYGTVPIVPNPRYAGIPQFALRVTGTSMNKIAKPGEYIVVASWPELGREARAGDLVVVRRQRAMTSETTVKRVRKGKGDNLELWPESDDPRHQQPIPLADGSREVEVRIIGRVIGKYTDTDDL